MSCLPGRMDELDKLALSEKIKAITGITNSATDWLQSASTDYGRAMDAYNGFYGGVGSITDDEIITPVKSNEEALKKLVPTQDKKVPNDEAIRNLGRKLGYDVPKEETPTEKRGREDAEYYTSTTQQNGSGQVVGLSVAQPNLGYISGVQGW